MSPIFGGVLLINFAASVIFLLCGCLEYSEGNHDFWKEMLVMPWRSFQTAHEKYNIIGSAILTWFVLWIYPAAFCAGIFLGLVFLIIWVFNFLFKKKS